MEIKDKLDKPYTKEQKLEFIVTNNHTLGYEIRESETALEAWGYTPEEIEEQRKELRKLEIDTKIKELQLMALDDIMQGNEENIKTYQAVINSLEENK